MTSENQKFKINLREFYNKHPILTIGGILGVWTGLLLSGFAIWLQGIMASKQDTINLLNQKLDDCQENSRLLKVELDSLRRVAKADSSILCPNDADHFLSGKVTVTLQKVMSYYNKQPQAWFIIEDLTTQKSDTFSTSGDVRYYEFCCGDEKCILYFLGYERIAGENCVRISVRKKT